LTHRGGKGRTIATVTGAVLGLLLGGAVGRSLDQVDRACYGETFDNVPDGDTVSWTNPNAGAVYQVTPRSTWQAAGGQYCREYVTTAQIDGQAQTIYGTACRQPDGAWQLMN
jgi:surface antigen